MMVDPDCTDASCDDEFDYWGDDGGWDSWDSYGWDGPTDGSVFSDYHDDLMACMVGNNCTIRSPNTNEQDMIFAALDQLSATGDPFCDQIYSTLSNLVSAGNVKFFDNFIRAHSAQGSGYLGGDAHPPNAQGDPYAGQIHVYDNGRSWDAMKHSLVHEAAHMWNAPDGVPSTSSSPYDWTADQIATYCIG